MAFFALDSRPGFAQHDAFAALGDATTDTNDAALDFDETYDGLGNALDDADDALNDDTFGGGPATQQSVGKDFDFAGQTSQVRATLHEEHMLFHARQQRPPAAPAAKPARTGYESYQDADYIPQLEARADIWGLKPKQPTPAPAPAPSQPKKLMSLDEVEAMMRAQATPAADPASAPQPSVMPPPMYQPPHFAHTPPLYPAMPAQLASQILPRPQQPSVPPAAPPSQPRYILQNPNRLAGQGQPMAPGSLAHRGPVPMPTPTHNRGPSLPGMVITHPEQLLQLSESERAAFLEEDARRAKRNHKIALLAKDNGLMTPQDKNFITRIQLQQLMTATGNLDEKGPEAAIAEDFYYHVFSQIRGAPRQHPQQPANTFAQTYLFQTNNRFGSRRNARGGDNHMQRMEQQIQRAVEAAKARPKARSLVVEGSLGKIAFSNSKTPRPLLNLKRPETSEKPKNHRFSIADRKEALRNVETIYFILLHMEDHERVMPPPIHENSPPEAIQAHMEWRSKIDSLHKQLWVNTKIMEPINPTATTPHPFISILSHAKGKKAIPRLFRHIDEQERITVVTMIVVHLDHLSVVSHGIATPEEPLPVTVREEIDLFSLSVLPPISAHINESPLNIIIGLLGLMLDRTNLHVAARTKIGLVLLTCLISRAEILRQSAPEADGDWKQWTELYNRLFDTIEPVLPWMFPGTINDTDDKYIWQFLAAMGLCASPEQQQRLVLGVKDRVMETVSVSKALPADMAGPRLANVNLFMTAIGLDVALLG